MVKNKALILAAVVIAALAAATTAQAYYETWNGWYSTGTLYYSGNAYTKSVDSAGTIYDSTYSVSRDTTYHSGSGFIIAFVYSAGSDTIFLNISSDAGGKDTGQYGQKEGNGVWSGSAIRRKNTVETTWNSVTGTWDTGNDQDGYYFDYNDSPATYDAKWAVDPTTTLSGGGTSSGGLQ